MLKNQITQAANLGFSATQILQTCPVEVFWAFYTTLGDNTLYSCFVLQDSGIKVDIVDQFIAML